MPKGRTSDSVPSQDSREAHFGPLRAIPPSALRLTSCIHWWTPATQTGAEFALRFVMSRARSFITDAMLAVTSLCTVMAGVSIISPDVRAQIVAAMAGDSTGQLTAMASRTFDFVHTLLNVVGGYGGDNMPLAGVGILAVVLAFMMFRM